MKWLALLTIFSVTTVEAARLICTGSHQGRPVVVRASGELGNVRAGSGSVTIDGRTLADFEGEGVRLNYFARSMIARNDRGDHVSARVTNLNRGTGVISRLAIRGYGINWSNIPVSCHLR